MPYADFSRFYDGLTQDVMYEKRAEYYHSLLASNGVGEGILLDLGCGTGSMSVPLAARGYTVIGVDISAEMLAAAREKAAAAGQDILFINQDMTELDLYGTVNAAICVLDGINHLDGADEVRAAFEKTALFTEPGGLFIFDVNTLYKHREILADNTFVFENDEVYCVWQNCLNDDDSVDITLDFFEKDGGVYRRSGEEITECAYPEEEIEALLRSCGFETLAVYDDMTLNSVNGQSERAVFVARKL